jgi:hypothetical protein
VGGASGSGGSNAGSGGSGGTCPSIAALFPPSGMLGSLDGRLMVQACSGTNTSDDCANGGWTYLGNTASCGSGQPHTQDFLVGGTPGVTYNVTMHFYGILEPRNYGAQVMRESGTVRPVNLDSGADPPPFATSGPAAIIATSNFNTVEIRIVNHLGQEVTVYYVNSDTTEARFTYVIDYARTIPVIGGGRVRIRQHDSNCRIIKNCGPTPGYPCAAKVRTQDISSAMPQPLPGELVQPGLGNDVNNGGQWWLLDVTNVACP